MTAGTAVRAAEAVGTSRWRVRSYTPLREGQIVSEPILSAIATLRRDWQNVVAGIERLEATNAELVTACEDAAERLCRECDGPDALNPALHPADCRIPPPRGPQSEGGFNRGQTPPN